MSHQFFQVKLTVAQFKVESTTGLGALQRRRHLKWKRIAFVGTVLRVLATGFQQIPFEHQTERLLGRRVITQGQELTRAHQFGHGSQKSLASTTAVQQRLQLFRINQMMSIEVMIELD